MNNIAALVVKEEHLNSVLGYIMWPVRQILQSTIWSRKSRTTQILRPRKPQDQLTKLLYTKYL